MKYIFNLLLVQFTFGQILVAEKMDVLESPTIKAERFQHSIIIDGNLDESDWHNAIGTDYFVEIDPGENIKPSEETLVKVGYDEENLYVAFWASANPDEIRASLQKRDQPWGDDFVAIFLDTYGTATNGTMIGSNPYGIQLDALNDGNNDHASYDLVYDSKGIITENGFQVEMAIPFSSLSFPDQDVQEWRVGFYRSLPREKRSQIVWGGFDRNDPCFLCQLGTLSGIKGIKQKGSFEFLPTLVGSQPSEVDTSNVMQVGEFDADVSLGVKYSFSSDRIAELSINPDFSQVEADEQQVDINTTFALYFREKRPFFNAGNDLIDTWIDAIYTRSINDPIAAGRIINRSGNRSWYVLSAIDENSPYTVPGAEQSFSALGGKSYSNIFRMKQSLNNGGFVGVLATDRRMDDSNGTGSVVGFDTRYRFNKMYQIELQTIFSSTQEPDDSLLVNGATFGDNHTFTFDGESFSGNAIEVELRRDTEHWNLEAGYDHSSPTFRAENGFVTNNDDRRVYLESVWIFSPNTFINKFVGGFYTGMNFNFEGEQKNQNLFLFSNLHLPGQTNLRINSSFNTFRKFKGITLENLWRNNINFSTKPTKTTSLYAGTGFGVRMVTYLDVPEKGNEITYWVGGNQKLSDQLFVGSSYTSYTMNTYDNEDEFYSGYLADVRINYQFNTSLSFRLIGQYNDFSKSFQVQPLLSYQPSPFTIFYVGTTTNQVEWETSSSQSYVKFQYLF